jgi:hypothetical protein
MSLRDKPFSPFRRNFSDMDVGLQGLLSKFEFDKQGRPILDVSGNIKLSEAGQAQLDRQKARPKRRRVLLPSTPHPFSGISSIAMNMARSQGLNGDSTQASPFTPNLGGFVPKFRLKAQPSMSEPTNILDGIDLSSPLTKGEDSSTVSTQLSPNIGIMGQVVERPKDVQGQYKQTGMSQLSNLFNKSLPSDSLSTNSGFFNRGPSGIASITPQRMINRIFRRTVLPRMNRFGSGETVMQGMM